MFDSSTGIEIKRDRVRSRDESTWSQISKELSLIEDFKESRVRAGRRNPTWKGDLHFLLRSGSWRRVRVEVSDRSHNVRRAYREVRSSGYCFGHHLLHYTFDLLSNVRALSRRAIHFRNEIRLNLSHLTELVLSACLGYNLGQKGCSLESCALSDCALLGSEEAQLA